MLSRDRGLSQVNLSEMTAYELVDLLERSVPELEPFPNTHTTEQLWHHFGARQLVLLLKNKKSVEIENAIVR